MGKKTKNILKTAGWVVLTPICLLLLLFVAIYIPPVQKWAVDLAADYLSSETGMQVSVGCVRLKFPLDLSLGNVLIVSPPDTVLDAEELLASVQPMPLFKGEVKVDYVTLTNTKLNTLDLIESMQLKYQGESLKVKDVDWNMNNGKCIVTDLSLQTSDISIAMADSVPEDTTTEEGSMLKWVDLKHVNLNDVAFALNMAPSDSMAISTHIGEAITSVQLDLENGNYYVAPLKLEQSAINYSMGASAINPQPSTVNGFDPNNIRLSDVTLDIDSLSYLNTGDLYVGIRQLAGKDESGLQVDTISGVLRMDSTTLYVDHTHIKTPESNLMVDMRMDMNAFETDSTAGTMRIDVEGVTSKHDILLFAPDAADQMNGMLPNRPITLALSAEGNMQHMDIHQLEARMDGKFDIKGRGRMDNGKLKLEDIRASYGRSKAVIKGEYDMESESYDIDINAQQLCLNDFVALSDPCHVSGHLRAKGRGFDFTSRSTYTNATLDLRPLR